VGEQGGGGPSNVSHVLLAVLYTLGEASPTGGGLPRGVGHGPESGTKAVCYLEPTRVDLLPLREAGSHGVGDGVEMAAGPG
jgi:hypothetical protein